MFEPFSSGYYLGRLYVEPYAGECAVIHSDHHEQVNRELYATGEGIERLDHPLVMKIGTGHVPVHGATGVPERTVALPDQMLDGLGIDDAPTLSEVFLAKADRAQQLLGHDPSPGGVA
jgi:hypothetical protein